MRRSDCRRLVQHHAAISPASAAEKFSAVTNVVAFNGPRQFQRLPPRSWSYDRRGWASLPAWPETSGRLARISKTPSARSAINMFGDDTKRRAFQRRRGRGRRSMSKRENFSALPMDAYGDRGQRDLSSENSRPLPEEGHRLMPAFLRIEKTSVREALVNFVEELSTRRTRSSANEAAGLSAADSETHRRQEHHMYIWDCARSPARPPVHPRHSFRVKPQTTKQKHKDEALHSRSDARTLGAEAEHRNPRRS